MTLRHAMLGFNLTRWVLAILTPEVTLAEIALMGLSWLLRRGPPMS